MYVNTSMINYIDDYDLLLSFLTTSCDLKVFNWVSRTKSHWAYAILRDYRRNKRE